MAPKNPKAKAQEEKKELPPWVKIPVGSLTKSESEEEYLALLATLPKTSVPSCLADFNYGYNDKGELRNLATGKGFAWMGQKHYDALGDTIVKDLQAIMREKYKLTEVTLPLDAKDGEPTTNVFHSENAFSAETLCLIIQGSGAVRASQWARALCINNTLELGTIYPYLERAEANGWGTIVYNPNLNASPSDAQKPTNRELGEERNQYWLGTPDDEHKENAKEEEASWDDVRGSESPQHHALYMWDNFVKKAAARDIVIVAHSYGGVCTTHTLRSRTAAVADRVRCVAFTDSVHKLKKNDRIEVVQWLKEHSINWVTSALPLGVMLYERRGTICVSAGHEKHEFTSGIALPDVFRYLEGTLKGERFETVPAAEDSEAETYEEEQEEGAAEAS